MDSIKLTDGHVLGEGDATLGVLDELLGGEAVVEVRTDLTEAL
jgi:hypothetical protein